MRDYICTSAPNTDWLIYPYQFFFYEEGCGYFSFDHSDDVGAGTLTIKNGRTEEIVYQQTKSFERNEDGRWVPVIVETGCRPDCAMHSIDCSGIDGWGSGGTGEGGFGGSQ
jgi:hypothetical protein